jgi:hypothetical protein
MLQIQAVEPGTFTLLKEIMGMPALAGYHYFHDAEESEEPISLKGQTWEKVKEFIQQKVSDFLC